MADYKNNTKSSDEQHGEIYHQEDTDGTLRRSSLVQHVEYDGQGIGAIIKSPYVFGAAFLASFGGFSFGYGELDPDICHQL